MRGCSSNKADTKLLVPINKQGESNEHINIEHTKISRRQEAHNDATHYR